MAERCTSEQYKYLLMKRLQRHFSMNSAKDRAYTQSFFWKLFDESVTVTEEAYSNFVSLMDDEIALCAEKGWYSCDSIPTKDIEEQGFLLTKAFATIGIDCKITVSGNGYAKFTKPNGESLTYMTSISTNYFYINSRAGTEYQYAKVSAPAYNMQGMDVPQDLGNPKIAGPGTYWSYNADTATVTITGDGAYAGVKKEEQIGSGAYTTIIIGADVSRLLTKCLDESGIENIVLLHAVDASLVMDDMVWGTITASRTWNIYADNEIFRNYKWGPRINITWHSLSEWGG